MRNLFFSLFALGIIYSDYLRVQAIECKDIESKSAMLRLKRHLFCDYDVTVRPSIHKDNITTINLSLMPKMIEFDDRMNTLMLHSWMALFWNDGHLKWNPEEFESIESIHVTTDEIWVPDIAVYNSGDMSADQKGLPRTDCILTKEGLVLCVPEMKYSAHCDADYKNWPFDIQNCTIRLGSWAHTGEEIDFLLVHKGITLQDYTNSKEWDLLKLNASKHIHKFKCCPNDTFPSVSFTFILERHSSMIGAIYITPAIILIVMTLTALWLDPNTAERMAVAVINFICHLLCFQDLHWQLPFNGASVPHILIFYRDSLVLAGFAIFLTTFLRQLHAISQPAPGWISSASTFMLSNKFGQIFLLNTLDPKASAGLETEADDNAGLVQVTTVSQGNDQSWSLIATLIRRLSFIGALLTYIIMLLLLLPAVTEISNYDRSTMMAE